MYRVVVCASAALLAFGLAPLSAAADDRGACQGDGNDAVRLIERDPAAADAHYYRGLHRTIGIVENGEIRHDEDRAIADDDQALVIDPNLAAALRHRAETQAALAVRAK